MQGVIAAVPTAVDAAGVPQKAAYQAHCHWAMENGCDGLNVLGSTGEATSFSQDAREQVMRWAIEAVGPEKLMVGTGGPSLADAIKMTALADDLGYKVALVLPPFYYKPLKNEGLIAWYMALHEALGDRAIRIYFYNYPQMTGLVIPVEVIAELHGRLPKRFAGIKDSSGDLDYCRAILSAAPDMAVFPSSETALVVAKRDGFAGCISATVNVTAAICARVWRDGAEAADEDVAALQVQRGAIAAKPLIPAIKHLVAQRSDDPIWQNVVPPFVPLSDEDRADLDAEFPNGLGRSHR